MSTRKASAVAALLVVLIALLFQTGSALAVTVIESVGVVEALWMRTAFAAVMLVAVRPRLLRAPAPGHRLAIAGLVLALFSMNLSFYAAISRAPIGVVVTIEFLGPLAVAVLGSRRAMDLVWVGLAGLGVALLAGPTGSADTLGLVMSITAAASWGAFLLLGKRAVTSMEPLAVTVIMLVGSSVLLTPVLAISGVAVAGHGRAIALGVLVALISSALPYFLELAALQRVRASTYGVLLSIEPAVAALAGYVILSQELTKAELLAIALVAVAAAGASWTSGSGGGEKLRRPSGVEAVAGPTKFAGPTNR